MAGRARIKARISIPSMPRRRPKGSSQLARWARQLASPMVKLARVQVMAPAGAATITARLRTKRVRSRRDLISIFPTWGLR